MVQSTAIRFDVTDPGFRRDPYPTYRLMRESAPVWTSPDGVTYFTRYADCLDVFRHPALSYDTTKPSTFVRSLSADPVEREAQLEEARRSRSLLNSDPPDHTRLRSLVSRAFTPQSVEETRTTIVEYVEGLIDGFESRAVDLATEFGALLPVYVICSMMNIPIEHRQDLVDISRQTARSIDPDVPLEDKLAVQTRLRDYIATVVAARREQPQLDLMSRLVDAFSTGHILNEPELLTTTAVLLLAGFETTANLITNAVFRLLEHPDRLAALRAEPALIGGAIEESLRYDAPLQFLMPRSFVEETEIAGTVFMPGDPVVPILGAANRDPAEFDDPETFTISRPVNRHVAFGVGHHRCIGSSLARIEAEIAVRSLVTRLPDLALDPDRTPEYGPNVMMRGFAHLWVTH
jgi:cytochrome P450